MADHVERLRRLIARRYNVLIFVMTLLIVVGLLVASAVSRG